MAVRGRWSLEDEAAHIDTLIHRVEVCLDDAVKHGNGEIIRSCYARLEELDAIKAELIPIPRGPAD